MNPWLLDYVRAMFRPNAGWYALIAAVLLTSIGVMAIGTVEPGYGTLQGQRWLPVALGVMLICMIPHPRLIGVATYPLAILTVIVLAYLILPGAPLVPKINGATSWIDLPGMRVQPSELAKVIFVLALARYLRYRNSYRTLRGLAIPFVIMFLPVLMILKQPDLGTALVFAPTLFAMLVAAGAKLRHLGGLLGIAFISVALVVSVTLWAPDSVQILKPHQRDRIVAMVGLIQGDTRYNDNEAYQADKAMTLIGAGGVMGYGRERASTIIMHNRLPHDHNDMIFAVVVNRWGLLGAWAVLGLYLVMVGSMLLVAARSKDPFARLACIGFAASLFTQASINIGMHVGLVPITGITLPFVSYGGSSLLATFAMIGLTLNFGSRRPMMLARPSFEFDRPRKSSFPRATRLSSR